MIDENGTTVACHAERAFEIDSYDELVRSGKLWHRDGMTWGGERVPELTIKKSMDQINGRVTHAGSMWVRPAARKRGLSLYLPYLSRALFLRNYEVRYLSGFVLSSLAGSRVPRTAYGFPHMEEYLSGWFPPTRRHEEKVFICYQNRVEAMERFRALPFHPEFPVQAPAAEAKVAVPSDLEVGKRPRVDADN